MKLSPEEIRKTVEHAKAMGWIKSPAPSTGIKPPPGKSSLSSSRDAQEFAQCSECNKVVGVHFIGDVKRFNNHRIVVDCHWRTCIGSNRPVLVGQV
jgi:hypothetical protein